MKRKSVVISALLAAVLTAIMLFTLSACKKEDTATVVATYKLVGASAEGITGEFKIFSDDTFRTDFQSVPMFNDFEEYSSTFSGTLKKENGGYRFDSLTGFNKTCKLFGGKVSDVSGVDLLQDEYSSKHVIIEDDFVVFLGEYANQLSFSSELLYIPYVFFKDGVTPYSDSRVLTAYWKDILKGSSLMPLDDEKTALCVVYGDGSLEYVYAHSITDIKNVNTGTEGIYNAEFTFTSALGNEGKAVCEVKVYDEVMFDTDFAPGYKRGSALSNIVANMKVKLASEDDNIYLPLNSSMVSGWDSSKEGKLDFEITHKNHKKSVSVYIYEANNNYPTKLVSSSLSSYFSLPAGKEINSAHQFYHELLLADGTVEKVFFDNPNLNISGFDKNKTGFQNVNFKYKGFSFSATLYVYSESNDMIESYVFRQSKTSGNKLSKIIPVTVSIVDGKAKVSDPWQWSAMHASGKFDDWQLFDFSEIAGLDKNNIKVFGEEMDYFEKESNAYSKILKGESADGIYRMTKTVIFEGREYNTYTYFVFLTSAKIYFPS